MENKENVCKVPAGTELKNLMFKTLQRTLNESTSTRRDDFMTNERTAKKIF